MTRFRIIATLVGIVLSAGASDLSGQSLFSAQGLGYPLEAQDARSRGLGGVGLGLSQGELSWYNPGGFIGLPAAGIVASYQHDNFTTDADEDFSGETARFPVVLAAFPLGSRAVIFAGYAGYLDQNWRLERNDTLRLASGDQAIIDEVSSEGGVSRVRAGVNYAIGEGLGVGIGIDAYTGSVARRRGRRFEDEIVPICCQARWDYGGTGVTGGVHWSPTEATSLAGSVTWGGALEATPTDSLSTARSYELPLLLRAGASARISQTLLFALGASWDGWSTLDEALRGQGGARDGWTAGAGIEWDAISLRDRPLPLRLGVRTAALPFSIDPTTADSWAEEQAVTGGLGLVLAGGAVRTDLSLEAGNRGFDGSPLSESFWRFGASMRVLGR